jgi:hypothetical protein
MIYICFLRLACTQNWIDSINSSVQIFKLGAEGLAKVLQHSLLSQIIVIEGKDNIHRK